MALPKRLDITVFLVLEVASIGLGFNLDLTTESLKFVTSPAIQSLSDQDDGSVPQLTPEIQPSFYGYHLSLQPPKRRNGEPSLLIGAPQMAHPYDMRRQIKPKNHEPGEQVKATPHGLLEFCPFTRSFFMIKSDRPECSPASPPSSQPGDRFGTSFTSTPNGYLSACSTGREMDCSVNKFSPGYCFVSENHGESWKMDPYSEKAECPGGTVDVLFVLDGSGSVEGHFHKVKAWVQSITKLLQTQLESGTVEIGVVQYSHFTNGRAMSEQRYMTTEIEIGQYNLYTDFARAVDAIVHQNFTTHTGRVLEKVRTDFRQARRFRRNNNKQVMILLTDGQSSDPKFLKPNAVKLRNMGVTTYAVGVGKAVQSELRQIAGSPERIYSVDGFDQLDSLVQQLQTKILKLVLEGGGGSSATVNYKMEMAQVGFSAAFEDRSV